MKDMIQKFDVSGEEKTHQQDEIQQYLALRKDIMASVEVFKGAVTRIRNILRGPGMSITGMDSMRHICLYLLSRYMTREKVASLDVPMEFAWETILEDARTKNGGVQFAIDSFYHTEGDCLVNHFDRLFGTEKFSFDVKNSLKHKEILEILDKVDMKDVDCEMDILGWVYEQHLKTGSSSASRDLGQFFTDRSVCEYMTELCKPCIKNGIPESVCDPSMGTGGFLTAYVKFFKKHYTSTPIDWSEQQQEIHGYDTDPRVAGVARLNLFMETGGYRSTNLLTHDSLYGDVLQTGFDVILANMPFGLKGIKYSECCERVRSLNIPGTKSEPLFLQLMMVSLNQGGRCAVVVPDGMLVNSSTCHNGTRKYLLEHFELKRVIKLEGKFFMNTGIKPSIMYFENTGKPTTAVEFWEVVKDEKGVITETLVVSVPREKLDAKTCALDMRRYIENEKPVANPAGWPMVKLREIATCKNGKNIPQRNRAETGTYPYYASNGICGYVEQHNFQGAATLLGDQGSCWAKSSQFVEPSVKFYAGNHTLVITSIGDNLNIKYLHYFLKLSDLTIYNRCSALIPELDKERFLKMDVPLPPLPVQQEIVATLDRIYTPGTTELADTLKMTDKAMDLVLANPAGDTLEPIVEAQRLIRKSAQMVADVKAQMAAIVNAVERRGYPMVKLGELCETPSIKKRYTNKETNKNGVGIPFYNGCYNSPLAYVDTINASYSSEDEYLVMIKDGGGDHESSTVGLGKTFICKGSVCIASQNVILVPKNEMNSLKFIYYTLCNRIRDIRDISTRSINLEHISVKSILDFPISLPPRDIQEEIVARLDTLQTQINAFESLQKQSADNARFIMDSYLGTM
jgi:restriction endonuclease S subunit